MNVLAINPVAVPAPVVNPVPGVAFSDAVAGLSGPGPAPSSVAVAVVPATATVQDTLVLSQPPTGASPEPLAYPAATGTELAQAAYATDQSSLQAQTLANDAEAAVLLQPFLAPENLPGPLSATLVQAGQGPSSTAAILSGSATGLKPGPDAKALDAAAQPARKKTLTTVNPTAASAGIASQSGHPTETEVALAAYQHQDERPEAHGLEATIDILD